MTDTSTKAVEDLIAEIEGAFTCRCGAGYTDRGLHAPDCQGYMLPGTTDTLRDLLAERDALQARREEFEADNIRLGRALGEMQGHTFFCQDAEGVLRRWYPPAAVPMFQPGEVVSRPATAAKGEGA